MSSSQITANEAEIAIAIQVAEIMARSFRREAAEKEGVSRQKDLNKAKVIDTLLDHIRELKREQILTGISLLGMKTAIADLQQQLADAHTETEADNKSMREFLNAMQADIPVGPGFADWVKRGRETADRIEERLKRAKST